MAIVFELVVNFGADADSAAGARRLVTLAPPVAVGGRTIGLHEPVLYQTKGMGGTVFLLLSVFPIGVGSGVAADHGHERVRPTAAELTVLGHHLYRLLEQFTGYQAARVGWDPEGFVDPEELRQDYADELAIGNVPGLVLAADVLEHLRGPAFVPFAHGFVWVPYRGERPSTLTADPGTG